MSTMLVSTATPAPVAEARPVEYSVEQVVAQVQKIQDVMKQAMRAGEHYGVIPGTQKPTLLKPGAEKLCLLFRLAPEYELLERREEDGDHLTVVTRCALIHIPTGDRLGTGLGSCSTRESKYAYRKAERQCPACGQTAIIKGKAEYGGGWVCFTKRGGCNAKYLDGDSAILNQPVGRVDNPDKADVHNTILKMSNKRALVAAVLNVTAASDCFTQDLEDIPSFVAERPAALTSIEPPAPPETAPVEQWLEAFTTVETRPAAEALWRAIQVPETRAHFTPTDWTRLTAAKDTAKARLTGQGVA